jgi:hypothetical protein
MRSDMEEAVYSPRASIFTVIKLKAFQLSTK